MNAADFGLAAGDLPRFALGTALFLLPGIAAADRFLPGGRTRFLLAPVFSFTLLPVAAILLSFAFGWKATPGSTALLALALAALAGSRRIARALHFDAPAAPRVRRPIARREWLEVAALAGILVVVAVAHGLPHMTGVGAATPSALPVPGSYPYPVHVDEQTHLAHAAFIVRNGTAGDPYTGERFDVGLFSLRGDVHERGFQMGLAQLSMLTGASLPLLFLWGASLWAALVAALVWGLARPHPGALAGAAFVAAIPTDVLFLGPSFLVPIAFGLAWVLATAWVALRGRGGSRVAALLALATAAFFIHLVAGAACLVVAMCAALVQPIPWRARLGLAVVALLPLAWVGPAVADEVARQLAASSAHPLGTAIFAALGWPVWLLFVGGAAAALVISTSVPHRAIAAFALVVAATVAGSLLTGHTSLALYYRSSHLMFLAMAMLAGHAVGVLRAAAVGFGVPRAASSAGAALLVALALVPAVAAEVAEPYYHVHDDASWAAGRTLIASGAKPGDVFLSEPWRAMMYNAMTGATPYTVLHPGTQPARAADWQFYLTSGGASAAWLHERHVKYVVSTVVPKAPHTDLGDGVYRIA